MKKALLILILLASSVGNAQQWMTDLDKALSKAAKENKKVLLFFSVPEHCESCKQLEQQVFQSDAFLSYAVENYILVKIDFSNNSGNLTESQREKNLLIVEKYNKDGFFPYVVVLNKDAKIIGKNGVYKNESPQQFIALLQNTNKS